MDAEAAAFDRRLVPPLVEAMMRPEFYPDSPGRVELKQTHISYVFLAGDFVYKVKKPVHFAFLDCSKLAQRFHFCCEEVRLNARLSPRVYLGVFAILKTWRLVRARTRGNLRSIPRPSSTRSRCAVCPKTECSTRLIAAGQWTATRSAR